MKRTRRTGLSAVFLFFLVLNVLLGGTAVEAAKTSSAKEKPLPWMEYVVCAGEDAESIATRHHLKSQYLLWANDLAPQAPLSKGMVLLVPRSSSELPATLMEVRARKAKARRSQEIKAAGKPSEKPTEKPSGKPSGVAKGTPERSEPSRLPDAAQTKGTMKSSELDSLLAAMTPEQRKLFGPKVPSKSTEDENAVVVDGGRRASRAGFIWPVVGRVSSGFGMRGGGKTKSGRVRRGQFHNGIDIPMPKGSPILAAKSGVVVEAGAAWGYGQRVVVDHGNGVRTLYAHCSKLLVKKGQRVVQGQRLATVGRTGRATCNHLHFVVYVKGKARNPVEYLPRHP